MKLENKLFDFLKECVIESGRISLEHYKIYDMQAEKGAGPQFSQQVVTEGDLAVQRFMKNAVLKEFPGVIYFSEESGIEKPSSLMVADGFIYKISNDEIDGTFNYGRKLTFFSNVVGVQRRKAESKEPFKTIMGFNYLPALDEMFHARLGEGSYLNGERIHVSDTNSLSDAIVADEEGWDNNKFSTEFKEYTEKIKDRRCLFNTATQLAYIADERFDGYTFCSTSPHDVTGPNLIVTEAGGNVYMWKRSGNTYHDSRYDIIVTNGKIDKELLEVSGKYGKKANCVLSGKHKS